MALHWLVPGALQVAEELGDAVRILKVDTDENPELSSQLQVSPPCARGPDARIPRERGAPAGSRAHPRACRRAGCCAVCAVTGAFREHSGAPGARFRPATDAR